MAVVSVAFNGTRLNDSDSNTNWGNFNVGGGAPASEFPLAYQVTSGTTSGAVNKKVNSTTARQGVDYNHGTGQDMTTAAKKLWFCKVYVADAFDLNATWGVEVGIGSGDTTNDHRYNIAGSGANLTVYDQYPAQGGYLITSIDPEITAWREAVNGTPNWSSVVWFAVGAQFINGTAKTENVALDSIDIGSGLSLTGGDGVSTDGDFTSFVATDQDVKANRWGVVSGAGDVVRAYGLLEIGRNTSGTAVATGFTDTTSVVLFPDGYHSRGTVGVDVDLGSATTVVTIGNLMIGEGTRNGVDANDTRPDFTVNGTSGSLTFNAQLRNFRDITFTSVVNATDFDIECHLLTQASANMSAGVVRTNALSGVACLQDPTFGSTTDLRDVEFIQTGAGHAIEIDTSGTYDFNDLIFTGYGADASNSAAVYISINAAVTINVNGGTTPTIRHSGTAPTINNSVPVNIRGTTEGTAVKVIANETVGTVTKGDVLSEGFTPSTGIYNFSQNYEGAFDPSGLDVVVRARNQGIATACIAEDGGAFTDETTEGSSNTTADMTLLPATIAVNDAYHFGHQDTFTRLKLDISTAFAGTSLTLAWEYWNGSSWAALTGLTDGTSNFGNTGANIVSWTLPGTWATRTTNGQGPLYYVRARVTAVSGQTATPVGRKVTLDVSRYLPYNAERTIESTGLTDTATWTRDLISKFDPTD